MENGSHSSVTTQLGLAVVVGVGVVLVCNYFLNSGSSTSGTANKKTPKFSRSETKKARPSSAPSSDNDDDEGLILRGYKTTSDGKKTSYFSRELSAADKALLESNSTGPRLLSSTTSTAAASSTAKASGSSWNTAGTFEERNVTDWALGRCSTLLRAVQCTCDCGSGGSSNAVVRVTRVSNVTGDCIVATSRGKAKLIYDLQADCDWELSHQGSSINGKISVSEITAERQYEFIVATSSSSPKVAACVKSVDRGLQPALRSSLDTLLSELQANASGQ